MNLKRILLGLIAILLLVWAGLHLAAKPAPEFPFYEGLNRRPLVIAHAGDELYPGDTLYALEQYAAMGVDILEMDIHQTQDGAIVLIHDDTVDDTTNGTGLVKEKTLAEIKTMDAAYHWSPDDGATFPLRGTGITIPTINEVFERFPNYKMIIEIKQREPSMGAAFCRVIRDYQMEDKVIVASFSDQAIQDFRSACPNVATSASESEVRNFVIRNFLGQAGTISPVYTALHVPESSSGIPIVNRWLLWSAKRKNIETHIWTINDPQEMQRFIDMGVDGIMTDRTDLLIELIEGQ